MKSTHSEQPARSWLEAWHVDPSANRNYDFIDGLRGLAILMVVACHYCYAKEPTSVVGHFLLNFSGMLGMGVNLFFTLSGFLISWPFWKRKVNRAERLIPPGYGWRRFWKIYPPLALSVLLLTPCFIIWMGQAPLFLLTAAQWLTGLAFLIPVSGKFNPVMWSLVVEIHFYLVLPLLFLLTKRLSAKTSLWAIFTFLFVVPMWLQHVTGLAPTLSPEINDPFFIGLGSFAFGVGIAGVDCLQLWNARWGRLGDVGWLAMLCGLVGLAWVHLDPSSHASMVSTLFGLSFNLGTGLLLCYAAAPENPRVAWLCTPWLRWCGIISYEWYLFHQPMIYWSRGIFGGAGGSVFNYAVILGVPLGLSLAVAALIYKKFSLPILQYGRARKSAQK